MFVAVRKIKTDFCSKQQDAGPCKGQTTYCWQCKKGSCLLLSRIL